MKLSIVIVNYNVIYFLEQCLLSVQKACKGLEAEIIVVDNNSVDGSVQMLYEKFPGVTVIANKKNTGFSFANNQAIKVSKGEYVLLLNPDTVVEEETFKKVVEFMDSHPTAGGLGVKMLDGKGKFLPESKRGLPTPAVAFYKIFGLSSLFPKSKVFGKYHLGYLDENKVHEIEILSGAFMLLRKATLDQIGLLDEAFFMYGEDIDLSYRIIKGGYKNYYFPDTRIIHYKGESTKKSSVNYVFVFYRAMVIFAQKHFSKKNASFFSALINIAIYMRASLAILNRFIKKIFLPLLDSAILLAGLIFLKDYYEHHFKFTEGGFYQARLVYIAFPIYTLIWIVSVAFNGGYSFPVSILRLIRGIITGTAVILILYSLLNEQYRFSRALILLGTAWALFSMISTRLLFHFLKIKGFSITGKIKKKLLIIGSNEETDRVEQLLSQTNIQPSFLGTVSMNEQKDMERSKKNNVGHIRQLADIIQIYGIDEVVFCAKDIPSHQIIDLMSNITTVDFKIAPPESLYIIGSNSIDTSGDLYVIDINSISKPRNKRKKRAFDILCALLFLIFSPVLVLLRKGRAYLLVGIFPVMMGKKSWVGYAGDKASFSKLPEIKRGVFSPANALTIDQTNSEHLSRVNLIYAKDYRVFNDITIIWKALFAGTKN